MQKENSEKECLPFHIDYLPESFYQKAQEELNETPETRQVELQKLKELISADKCTADIDFEVDFLHQYLRHSKYNSTKAFQNVLKYVKYRRNHSSLFEGVPMEYFKGNSTLNFVSVLPYRCTDGCTIIVSEMGKWNQNEIPFEDFKRIAILSYVQPLRCPLTQICGYKIIHDLKDTHKHLRYCTPSTVTLFYNMAFNCIPARYQEVHLINKNVFLTIFWSVLKHFLSEKMRKRFIFHSKPEDLLNHFPKSVIPTQYGGSLEDYHDSELMRKMNKEHENFPMGGMPNYF